MVGAVAGGILGDRFGLPKVVVGFFATATVSIALVGFDLPSGLLFLAIFVAGATTIGMIARSCSISSDTNQG
jgi:AAHS family benzoate transporter-like MFS transporter